jgi:Mor family transcriptional regulator
VTIRAMEPAFGRYPRHYALPSLTPAERDEVGFRRMEGETVRSLAAEYGVTTDLIRKCVPKERT